MILAFQECRNKSEKTLGKVRSGYPLLDIGGRSKKIRGTSSRRLGTLWNWVRYAGQEAHAISCMGILLSQM